MRQIAVSVLPPLVAVLQGRNFRSGRCRAAEKPSDQRQLALQRRSLFYFVPIALFHWPCAREPMENRLLDL